MLWEELTCAFSCGISPASNPDDVFLQTLSVFLLLFLTVPTADCVAHHSATPFRQQFASAEEIHIPGISNARQDHEFLYRGGQPNDEGVLQLKKLGINTIVDLRRERHDTMEKERKHAESLGMSLANIPGNVWSPPRDEQVAQFFSLVRERPRRRIFVHCWLGADRSGVFVAIDRIAFDGWTPEQALEEMLSFHFKGFWHPAMKAYIRDFPARLAGSPVLASFREIALAKKK